jgi:hypothetical protein
VYGDAAVTTAQRAGPIPVAIEGGEALADSYVTVET